jgi:hypothetical protein
MEDLELETVTIDLQHIAQTLYSKFQFNPLVEEEILLQGLAQRCRELATELLGLLEELKIKDSHNRKWESFRQALKRVRGEKAINNLEERLQKFREQLSIRLISLLRFVSDSQGKFSSNEQSAFNSRPS